MRVYSIVCPKALVELLRPLEGCFLRVRFRFAFRSWDEWLWGVWELIFWAHDWG